MQIQNLTQLRNLYSAPTDRVIRKEITALDHHLRQFIALSPFLVIASGNTQLNMDASPRGGTQGFACVLDDHNLLIPDAPGNNRLDTLQNILETSQVGLLFFIPGVDEMLRIHGHATLHDDADLLAHFSNTQQKPKLVIKVKIEGAYMHCAKAIMRSKLWAEKSKVDRAALPSMGQIIKDHAQLDGPVETREEMLKRYEKDL